MRRSAQERVWRREGIAATARPRRAGFGLPVWMPLWLVCGWRGRVGLRVAGGARRCLVVDDGEVEKLRPDRAFTQTGLGRPRSPQLSKMQRDAPLEGVWCNPGMLFGHGEYS